MKTRLATLLLGGLAAIMLANGCNGANEITGPPDPGQGGGTVSPPPKTVTPRQVTPNPCRRNQTICD